MKMMGAEILFLTNAAGGVNFDFQAGDFMMITDQISNFVPSPLIGPNIEELGERFCDMSEIYNKELCGILRGTAADLGISLKEGTYIQLLSLMHIFGPHLCAGSWKTDRAGRSV